MLGLPRQLAYRKTVGCTLSKLSIQFGCGNQSLESHEGPIPSHPSIRIHKRQLAEMQRLLRYRIAPMGSEINECLPDTAGQGFVHGTS
jgi:hypothetical protein